MARLVAIDLPGGPDFLAALRRVWDAGDTALPVDQRLPGPAREALFRAVRPSSVWAVGGRETARPDGVPTLNGDAVVIATSGTTGDPKGVILTHDALLASATASSRRIGADPGSDRWYGCLPVAHIGGFSVVTKALLTGTPLTLTGGFSAGEVEAASATHTLISLVATALTRVRAESWRVVLLGGSALPEHLPATVVRTYGLTETGSGVVYDGAPIDGAELRDVDGEIHVRGPMLFRAYRTDTPEGSDARSADGWFATGDAGAVDETGRLSVRGRIGEVIVTGGEKVWPDAVERALTGLAGVREVAVAGRPDPEWGHRVVAWVVPADPAHPPTLEAVRGRVREHLPAYAAPKRMVIVGQLPRTAIGKIQRSLLPDLPDVPAGA